MKIAIIGFAREGQAALKYWGRDDNDVTICDRNDSIQVPKDINTQLGSDYLKGLGRFDLIVRTAGLHPREIARANPETPDILDRVTSGVNEFLRICPTRNIIGVTGTKGKGTTCMLITAMLQAAGYRTHLGGNIGIPALELLDAPIREDDWVVLELSSFQLLDLKSSPHIAVCVTIAEEHLNWHEDYLEYITAKQQLFRWQKPDDIAIYYGNNDESKRVASVSAGRQIPYMQSPGAEVINDERLIIDGNPVCHVSEIPLLGRHNWQNVCAAVTAAWQVTHDLAGLHQAIVTLPPLAHRLEPLGEFGSIAYFNDSFSSAPPAAIAALDAVGGHKVLIIGGQDRGLDLAPLATAVAAHAQKLRKVLVIGEAAPRITAALDTHHFSNYDVIHADMPEIVARARHAAHAGDSIILSPGFPSFDMFKDFEDRGNQFKEAVQAL